MISLVPRNSLHLGIAHWDKTPRGCKVCLCAEGQLWTGRWERKTSPPIPTMFTGRSVLRKSTCRSWGPGIWSFKTNQALESLHAPQIEDYRLAEILRYRQHKSSEGFYAVNVRAGTDLDAALGAEQDIAMVLQPGCTAQPPGEELRNLNAPAVP